MKCTKSCMLWDKVLERVIQFAASPLMLKNMQGKISSTSVSSGTPTVQPALCRLELSTSDMGGGHTSKEANTHEC